MKIQIKRTGGFAGIEQTLASADLAALPPATAAELQRRLTELTAAVAGGESSVGADRLHYEVEVNDGPGAVARTLTVIDEGNPNAPAMRSVRSLLAALGAAP